MESTTCELQRRLADPDLELPPSRVPGFDLDCPLLSRKIAPAVDELGEALDAARDHTREVEVSERRRNEALAAFNEAFLHSGDPDPHRLSRLTPRSRYC